ncbi:hypothetical protein HMH01_07605 [Halovulum dunhuangense]|uniref:Uncharacterized protein n=1 Tax=Halovulum dunhuangense TaxID=1505036 RepID=A0A849L234_9RHOB|nr:hypothetical protein [Halovulum dunhuangense]NNU80304.1 hypothetical protein [Halovulum dunhuangense]
MIDLATHGVASRSPITRRRVLGAGLGLAVALPAARIGWLRLQDNPLPQVPAPRPVLRNGWVLDATDPTGEPR